MELEVQFQTIIVCFILGIVYGLLYGFYNRCVLKIRLFIIRLILECIINGCFTLFWFYTMLYLNNGCFYLYHFLFFFLGIIYYLLGLSKGYLRLVEKMMSFFHILFLPFGFIIIKIRDILFPRKKRGDIHGKKKS